VVFEGIISTAKSWRGRHIRLNLGKTSVSLSANGRGVPITPGPNPAGFDFTPRRHKTLPVGQRPCG
jgi:hypothetical protein